MQMGVAIPARGPRHEGKLELSNQVVPRNRAGRTLQPSDPWSNQARLQWVECCTGARRRDERALKSRRTGAADSIPPGLRWCVGGGRSISNQSVRALKIEFIPPCGRVHATGRVKNGAGPPPIRMRDARASRRKKRRRLPRSPASPSADARPRAGGRCARLSCPHSPGRPSHMQHSRRTGPSRCGWAATPFDRSARVGHNADFRTFISIDHHRYTGFG